MKALIQRVSNASVEVGGEVVGEIQRGLLVLLGLDKGDDLEIAKKLVDKVLNYRVFPDAEGRMNLSVSAAEDCAVLLVSQFTLSADTRKGLRPSFSSAMAPDDAEALYEAIIGLFRQSPVPLATGMFGADMQVSLVNDGPVTFMLEINPD